MTAVKRKGAKRGRQRGNAKVRRGRTAPGPLTPTGGNKAEATQEATRNERRRQAWRLYVYERMSMQAIAEYLSANGMPCSNKTVCQDIHAMFEENKAEMQTTARHGIDMELRRLDQVDRQLMPLAAGAPMGDRVSVGTGKKKKTVHVPVKAEPRARLQLDALAQLRRNGESRRKLLGLDQQPDEGYVKVEHMVNMVRGLVTDVLVITSALPEIRKALAEAMQKRFGVIDVTPTEAP